MSYDYNQTILTLHYIVISVAHVSFITFNSSFIRRYSSKMAQRTWRLISVITLFTILSIVGDVFSTTAAPWYENLPAVTMDYKVHIDAGKEDCYYQYVQPGATFYASYQVLKGGDGMCGFAVRHPNGQIVHPYEWRQSAEYADQSSSGGYYAVCIDNQFSRFAGKLVNLYLSVIRYDMWDKYAKEVEELDMNIKNFTTSIQFVERNINDILQYQYHSRARESRDYNLLQDNNTYVLRWSLLQILAVAATGTMQVYFVKKLFEVKDNSSKTRI